MLLSGSEKEDNNDNEVTNTNMKTKTIQYTYTYHKCIQHTTYNILHIHIYRYVAF